MFGKSWIDSFKAHCRLEDAGGGSLLNFVEVSDHDGSYVAYDGRVLPILGAHIHVDPFWLRPPHHEEDLTGYIEVEREAFPTDLAGQPSTTQPAAKVIPLPNTQFAANWNRFGQVSQVSSTLD